MFSQVKIVHSNPFANFILASCIAIGCSTTPLCVSAQSFDRVSHQNQAIGQQYDDHRYEQQSLQRREPAPASTLDKLKSFHHKIKNKLSFGKKATSNQPTRQARNQQHNARYESENRNQYSRNRRLEDQQWQDEQLAEYRRREQFERDHLRAANSPQNLYSDLPLDSRGLPQGTSNQNEERGPIRQTQYQQPAHDPRGQTLTIQPELRGPGNPNPLRESDGWDGSDTRQPVDRRRLPSQYIPRHVEINQYGNQNGYAPARSSAGWQQGPSGIQRQTQQYSNEQNYEGVHSRVIPNGTTNVVQGGQPYDMARTLNQNRFDNGPINSTRPRHPLDNQMTATQRVIQLENDYAELNQKYKTVVNENQRIRDRLSQKEKLLAEIQDTINKATAQLQNARTENQDLKDLITQLRSDEVKIKQQTDSMLKTIQNDLDDVLAKKLTQESGK